MINQDKALNALAHAVMRGGEYTEAEAQVIAKFPNVDVELLRKEYDAWSAGFHKSIRNENG